MSENRKKYSGRLSVYGDGALIDWLKKGYLPLLSGVAVAEPFIRYDQWSQSDEGLVAPEALDWQWQRYYEALPDAVRGLLSFEHFRQQGGAIERDVVEAARRQNQPNQAGYDLGWLDQARYLRLFPSVACFLAWMELGEAFSGLAIELDSGHGGFESTRENPTVLAPVIYGGFYRASISATNPFPGLLEDHPARQNNQEWRLLMLAKKVKTVNSTPVLSIPRGLVTGIYWSTGTSREVMDSVRTLASQDMRFRGMQLGQVVPDESAWRLRVVRE